MFGRIKLRRADILYSRYLRAKRGYKCEKCGVYKPEGKGLQISHFHGRRKESVRFDEENTDVLCVSCHMYFESHKTEYEVWKFARLGRKAFDLLTLRANQTKKRDDKLIIAWIKAQEA